MELVYILASELKEWPEYFEDVGQAKDGSLHSEPYFKGHTREKYTKSTDWQDAIVTRAQWQAAVDALKAGEQPAFIREGLPNIGTTCEGRVKNEGSWRKYTVKAMSTDFLILWCEEELREIPIRHSYWEFRPALTAEQIAAQEQRTAGAKEIASHIFRFAAERDRSAIGECLYDAGYRKQVQP